MFLTRNETMGLGFCQGAADLEGQVGEIAWRPDASIGDVVVARRGLELEFDDGVKGGRARSIM